MYSRRIPPVLDEENPYYQNGDVFCPFRDATDDITLRVLDRVDRDLQMLMRCPYLIDLETHLLVITVWPARFRGG